MDNFNDKQKLSSDFNEAAYQIERLHNLWMKCNHYSTSGLLDKWKFHLDAIKRELGKDIKDLDKDKEKNTYNHKINLINLEIAKVKYDKDLLYLALQKKDELLREVQEDTGKGSKKSFGYEKIF